MDVLYMFIGGAIGYFIGLSDGIKKQRKEELANEVRVNGCMILQVKGILNTEAKNKLMDKGFKKVMENIFNGCPDWNHNVDKDILTWKIECNDFEYIGYLINMIENDSDFEEVIWAITKDN